MNHSGEQFKDSVKLAEVPGSLQLNPQSLAALEGTLAVPWPEEGCALLLGEAKGQSLELQHIWPCQNVWHPNWPEEAKHATGEGILDGHIDGHSRCDRFAVDPRELIAAQKYGRQKGLVLLGVAHSHTRGPSHPSALDRCHGWPQTIMWISALVNPTGCVRAQDRSAWWVRGPGSLQPLSIDLL